MNWQTFWMAVEAIATVGALACLFVEALATVGALIFLFVAYPRLKKEIAARKVEGLRYAREQLESEDFQNWYTYIIDSLKADGDEFPEGIHAFIVDALARIDFVAKLIELDYVDKDLLLYIFANQFVRINIAMTNFDHRKNSRIPDLRASFPKGFALLKEASSVVSKGSI